jgi:hypothetical protein
MLAHDEYSFSFPEVDLMSRIYRMSMNILLPSY